jgi:hypothetical protein
MCSGFFQTISEHVDPERLHTNTSHKMLGFMHNTLSPSIDTLERDQILYCTVGITVPQSSLPRMNGAVAFIYPPDDARKLLKARIKDRNIRMPAMHPPPLEQGLTYLDGTR